MNKKEFNFLNEKLMELIQNNIISEEQYVNANNYFSQMEKTKKSITTIFTGIGFFLIALSVITLFAINWSVIPTSIKAIISFIPIIITAIMMFLCMTKNDDKLKFYTSIVAPVSILATNSLIGQIFHIQSEIYELFFLSLIMFMPIAFILRNYLSIIVYGIGTLLYVFDIEESFQYLINTSILVSPLIIYNIFNYIKEKETKKNLFMWITNVIIVTSVLFEFEIVSNFSVFLYGYLIYLMTKTLFSKRNILTSFLKLVFIVCMLFFCFWGIEIPYEYEIDIIIIALLTAFFIYLGKFYKEPNEYFIFAFIVLFQFWMLPDEYRYISLILVNALTLVFGIFKIVVGNKKVVNKEILEGVALVLSVIMIRFMSSEWSFAIKSIMFLIAGVTFMIIANILKKKEGGKNNE